MTVIPQRQYYPSFLLELKNRSFNEAALQAAFHSARIGGKVRGENDEADFFREFRIDEIHWHFHQRILNDDVLFRLVSEGFLHPTIHPVAAIYHDSEFYSFVFPFIHTAILKDMALAIRSENSEGVKLLLQWLEPFGDYFHQAFYRMIEFSAGEILKELAQLNLNRKIPSFDTYSRISPALMHLLNRLPDEHQLFRDTFAQQVIQFAVWLRNDMKVYTQPGGMITRLKLLQTSPDIHAQIDIQLKNWEKEKELAAKEKFNLNHLIWIIPLVFIIAFVIYRNTEFGKSFEDIHAEKEMSQLADQQQEEEKWEKINLRMENIDLNKLIAEELFVAQPLMFIIGLPIEADKDPNRLDNGEEPYKEWLQPGRKVYPTRDATLEFVNDSKCDVIVFVRQDRAPFMERAYYVKSGRSMTVFDDGMREYSLRIYAGTGWTDSLVTENYNQKLIKAGVPDEVHDQFPSTTELRGRFLYPAKSIGENLQAVWSKDVKQIFVTPDGTPIVRIEGDWEKIKYSSRN